MTPSGRFAEIALALATSVGEAAGGAKRLKLRTLLARFGYEKRSDANTVEITEALNQAGLAVSPPLVRLYEEWEISLDDWIVLATAEDPTTGLGGERIGLPQDWNKDGWFDRVVDLKVKSEKEVGIKFAVPLLHRLGYGDDDRIDGMPVKAAVGAKPTSLEIDHAVFNSSIDTERRQPLLTVETKRSGLLRSLHYLQLAHNQAKSYCFWTQCNFFMTTDGEVVNVYRVDIGGSGAESPEFACEKKDLKDRFVDLYALVSRGVLTGHYLCRFSSPESTE